MFHVDVGRWRLTLPDGLVGGERPHQHEHLRRLAFWQGTVAGHHHEVVVSTYTGPPTGEHGERLDADGRAFALGDGTPALRRDQRTRLDDDPEVEPVETVIVVVRHDDSVAVVVHRPIGSPSATTEAIVSSLRPASG